MLCPKCGKEMKKGFLCGRGYNYFLPEGEKAPNLLSKKILEKKHAVLLPPDDICIAFCQNWPKAFWCGDCKMLIADYSELME